MPSDGALARPSSFLTDRLRMRPFVSSDAAAIFEFKSDPKVTSCYGQKPHRSLEETRAWVENRISGQGSRDSIFLAITERQSDKAIGECCLWNFRIAGHRAEIGYELHPSYWHRGYMSEALPSVIAYGFNELNLNRIEATPLARNNGSIKLLLRLGFRFEGRLEQRHFFDGRFEDQVYFGLLRKDWANR